MLVIAGLGNPGRQYAGNRHNIGFMAADAIHRRHGFSPWTRKSGAEIAEGRLGGEKTILIKPQTFMNLSGQAIGEIARYYKVPPENIIVIHDELDLAPGKIKTKIGGGHGGHNGLKSTDAHIGNDYRRVRIGIGHPGSRERVNGHVLGDFAKADQEWLEPTLDALAKNIVLLAEGEEDRFKSTIGSQTAPPETPTLGSKKPKADRASVEEAPGEPLNTAPKRGPMAEMLAKFFKTTE